MVEQLKHDKNRHVKNDGLDEVSEGSDGIEEINCPGSGSDTESEPDNNLLASGPKRGESVIELEQKANENAVAIFKSKMAEVAKVESFKNQIARFTESGGNPMHNLAVACKLTPRIADFSEGEDGLTVATCLSAEAQRWAIYLRSFKTSLIDLQHSIRQLKQDSATLDKKFNMLLQRDEMIKSSDFNKEFELLDQSVNLFKETNDELKRTSETLTWEVHGYISAKDLDPEKQAIVDEKRNSLRVIDKLTKGKYDEAFLEKLERFQEAKLAKQQEAEKQEAELLGLQKIENEKFMQQELVKMQIQGFKDKISELNKATRKLNEEIDQDDKLIEQWRGKLSTLDQSNLEQTNVVTREQILQQVQKMYEKQIMALKKQNQSLASKIAATGNPDSRVHFTFICDSSGSMSSKDYNQMMAGIESLLSVRQQNGRNHYDRYSIVQFGRSAELIESDVPVTKPFVKPQQWGKTDTRSWGTDFNEAFKVAIGQIKIVGARNHFVLFLTDGHGTSDQVQSIFEDHQFQLVLKNMKSFNCFCIGYSNDYSRQDLNRVSTLANGRTFKFFDDARIDYVVEADQSTVANTIGMLGRIFELEFEGLRRQQEVLQEQIAYIEKEQKAECERRGKLFDEIEGAKNEDFSKKKERIDAQIQEIEDRKKQKAGKVTHNEQEVKRLETNEIAPRENQTMKDLALDGKRAEEATRKVRAGYDKLTEELKTLEDELDQLEKEGQQRALEALKSAEKDQKSVMLAESHNQIKHIQGQVSDFIQQVEKTCSLVLRFTTLCVDYVKDKGFLDSSGGITLPQFVLSSVATHFKIPHSEDELKFTSNMVFGKVIRALLTKDDPPENIDEHLKLLKDNFDFQDFVYDWFDLKNPLKKQDTGEEEEEPETLEDIAKKHFQCNVVSLWKKELKKIQKEISSLEKKQEKAEKELEKAEEKENQKLIEKAQTNLDSIEKKLEQEGEKLDAHEEKEEEVQSQLEINQVKYKEFMRSVKEVKKLIMTVGCIKIRELSETRIKDCFKTYIEGVAPQLDQVDEAIPLLAQVMDTMS